MNFGNIGFMEVMILLVIVLLLFGAKRIPEIAGSFGKGINEFKRNLNEAKQSIQEPPRSERVGGGATPAEAVKDEERPEPKRLLN